MELKKYFDLDINPDLLYRDSSKVIKGIHGISINDKGEHFASAFHIYLCNIGNYKVIAKTEMQSFLLNKFPGKADLANEYKKHFSFEEVVQHEGGFLIKKIKLEWIAEMFEKETKILDSKEKSNVEKEIFPLLNKLSDSVVFKKDAGNSHHHLFQDIFHLIQHNPDKYEVLSLVYFTILFEKTCDYLFNNSAKFKNMIDNFFSNKHRHNDTTSKLENESYKTYTISNYVNFIKFSKIQFDKISKIQSDKKYTISIEIFQDKAQPTLMKTFADIYYFIRLRNNLIHNEFINEDSIEILNSSKKMLKFTIDIIDEYLQPEPDK